MSYDGTWVPDPGSLQGGVSWDVLIWGLGFGRSGIVDFGFRVWGFQGLLFVLGSLRVSL